MNWGYDAEGERYWPLKWIGPLTLDGGFMMPTFVGTPEPGPPTRHNRFAQHYMGIRPTSPSSLFAVLARTWALGSIMACHKYRDLGERLPNLNFEVEKLYAEHDDLWMVLAQWYVEGHHVVVSLLHMEEWYERAGGKTGKPLDVKKLRNSLEHLNETLLEWDRGVRDPALGAKKKWSLTDLPESSVPLRFDLHMIDSIFGLVDVEEAAQRAMVIHDEMKQRMNRPPDEPGAAFKHR